MILRNLWSQPKTGLRKREMNCRRNFREQNKPFKKSYPSNMEILKAIKSRKTQKSMLGSLNKVPIIVVLSI